MNDLKEGRKLNKGRYLMATRAIHKLGDISSDEPDICHVYAETDDDWIGSWVTGLGFFNIHFPKETTRALNDEELARYKKQHIAMGDLDMGTILPQDYVEG